jgi:hypothetical protein
MAITYTTWNPDDKAANITLSNGDLVATLTSTTTAGLRSILGVNSGKWYWEITVGTLLGNELYLGIGDSAVLLTTHLGFTSGGYSYHGSGLKINNNSSTSYGNSYTSGAVISVALDLDAGKLWWAKNGVWQASGDPAAGTNEAFSGISGTFYAAISMFFDTNYITANFGASAFTHSVPSGFNSGFYSVPPVEFTFTNPTPAHLSAVYGTTEQVCLTTTISGEAASYVYDATFYDEFDVQIGTAVFGINSGSQAASNAYLSTPSGIDYGWYMIATSSGSDGTSSTYTFHNRFLYEGYVTENDNPISRKVNLYYRNTGELIDTTTSSGSNGYYKLSAVNNDTHFIVTFDDEAGEDYNALILDKLLPVGSE